MSLNSRSSHKSTLQISLIVILLIFVSYGLYAYWVLSHLKEEISAWAADYGTNGWTLAHEEAAPVLYFDHASIRFSHLQINGPSGEVTAEHLAISRYFLDPGHIRLVLSGPSTLRLNQSQWRFSTFPLRIDLRVSPNNGEIKSLQATATDVQVVNTNNAALFAQALGLSLTPQVSTAPQAKSVVQFIGTAAGLEFKNTPADTTPAISVAEIRGKIMGTVLPTLPDSALAAWNSAGGTMEIERFMLDWPPVKLEGDGTLALDQNLQPIAALSAKMQGLTRLADTLQQTGDLTASAADSLRSTAHGQSVVATPVTLQNGKVWVGPIAIIDQPQIQWPK